MAPAPRAQAAALVDGMIDHLQHLKESGQKSVRLDPDVLGQLAKPIAGQVIPGERAAVPPQTAERRAPPPSAKLPGKPAASAAHASGTALGAIAERIAVCTACGLCQTRTRTVPGQGATRPDILFVGEGPGADEDAQGLAFVGRAGQLLTKMIKAMGYEREDVWIGNIVKCRPPNNRAPTLEEMAACLPYLKEQIGLLQPRVMVCMGATAVKGLFETATPISKIRGTWLSFEGIDTMPTFHPAYLLRNPSAKRVVWQDLKAVLEKLGKPVPQG